MTIGFAVIENAFAVTYKRGVYKQVAVFHRKGSVYAKSGAGFIRLNASGSTSDPNTLWRGLEGCGDTVSKPKASTGGAMEYQP